MTKNPVRITSVNPVGGPGFDLPPTTPRGVLIILENQRGSVSQLSLTVQQTADLTNRLSDCIKEVLNE